MDTRIWTDMFVLALPVLEKVLRTIFVYFALIIGLRLAGKRELAQLNPFDLVVLLTLSNTVQNAIIGEDNSVTGGIIGAAVLLAVNYAVARFAYKNHKVDEIIEGKEDVLIDHGKLLTANLDRESITVAEVEIAAHRQGFSSLSQVERAVLEPGGGISFISSEPQPEELRHHELLTRLDSLSAEMNTLRTELAQLRGK